MRVFKIFCFILFLPLVMGFSQATAILGGGCIHCQNVQQAQPDCCANMNVNSQAMGVEKLTKNERGCPHSGLCEGDNNSSIDVLPITSSIEIAVPLKFATVASDYSPIDNQWGNTVLSPPLKKPPSLYTLNCSFLI